MAEPFSDLVEAINSLWYPNNTLFLLNGVHFLKQTDLSAAPLLTQIGLQRTVISALLCSNTTSDSPNCVPYRTTIQLTHSFTAFTVNHTVLFEHVDFRGDFDVRPDCFTSECAYCPYITFNTTQNLWVDDRFQPVDKSKVAIQSYCDFYHDKDFLRVAEFGTLNLTNVQFLNFRQQLHSLIWVDCGTVLMSQVDFVNGMAAPVGLWGGLLRLTSPAQKEPYSCGTVKYAGGHVSLLNNGYEYRTNIELSGFLAFDGVYFLSISHVFFEYNFIPTGELLPTVSSALLSLNKFREVRISNCSFNSIIADSSALLYIDSYLSLPLIPSNGISQEHALTHLLISDCVVKGSASQRGAILGINFHVDHQNVLLSNVSFYHCFSMLGVVMIGNDELVKTATDGRNVTVNGFLVFLPPTGVIVRGLQARDSLGSALLQVSNIGNLLLSGLVMLRVGEDRSGFTSYVYVFEAFKDNSQAYLSMFPELSTTVTCSGVASVTNILNLSIEHSVFDQNYCPNGVPGLILSGQTNDIRIHANNFTRNTGFGAITLAVRRSIEISTMLCANNSNLLSKTSVCLNINLVVPSDIVVVDSQFVGNIGLFCTVMFAGNTQSLTLRNVQLISNQAIHTTAGIWFNPKAEGPSAFIIENCVFRDNKANKNGVITISDFEEILSDNEVAIIDFQIRNTVFEGNIGSFQGASITFNQYIKVTTMSLVQNCTFLKNAAQEGACGFFTFQFGVLTFKNCVFTENSASKGAAVFANHFPATSHFPSSINFVNCVFRQQHLGPTISILGYSTANEVAAAGNLFIGNEVGAYVITAGNLVDRDSVYTLQRAAEGPVFYIQLICAVKVFNLTAYGNRATLLHGGVFFLTTHSQFQVYNSRIYNNSAVDSGAVVWADENSNFEIENSDIFNNSAGVMGSTFFIMPGSLLIRNCQIHNNFAGRYSTIFIIRGSAIISNLTFFNNTSLEDSPGIILSASTLTLNDSWLHDQIGLTGPFLFSIDHSSIDVYRTKFSTGTATFNGGAVYISMKTDMRIVSSVFENCAAEVEGGAVHSSESSLLVEDTHFKAATAKTLGGGIYANSGQLWVKNCVFEAQFPSAVYVTSMILTEVTNSVFQQGSGELGGALGCSQSRVLTITGNNFTENHGNYGGAVYIVSSGYANDRMDLEMNNNSFFENSALSGGAAFINSVNASLSHNRFSANSALSTTKAAGVGGGLALVCDLVPWCSVSIYSNAFKDNTASAQGGAVAWVGTLPTLSSNQFEGNVAPYGRETASYAVKIATMDNSGDPMDYLSEGEESPVALELTGVASGQTFHYFLYFGLFDHANKIIANDYSSSAELYSENTQNASVSGNIKVTAAGGKFAFEEFAVTAKPGSTLYLTVGTTAVDTSKGVKARDGLRYIPQVRIQVEMRLCEVGESQFGTVCFLCAAGTYSLNPALPCKLCPEAAHCYGNFTMVPKPGYWRANNMTENFIKCLETSACVGSPDNTFISYTGLCASGYSGNLCQSCIKGYSRTGRYQCGKCPGLTSNIAITSLIVIVALLVVALIVFTAIRSAQRPRSLIAIYLKIFMNYLQMIVVSSSLNLNWPSFVRAFLSGQEEAGGVAEQLFSFECLLQDANISQGSMYFAKILGISCLPLVMFALAGVTWLCVLCCFHIVEIWLKTKATLVVILFILHPNITKLMFAYFACMDLGTGELWLISDLSIKCWDAGHVRQILLVVLPSIIIWVVGLPTIALFYLVVKRHCLETWNIKQVFSFLYKGYERPYFYWEFVILYRKVALISASVFLGTVGIRTQALTVLALLLLSLFLQIQVKPFNEPSLNKLEIRSILVSAITIYAGLYYESENVSTLLSVLIFAGMLFANGYFLVLWLLSVSPILFQYLTERIRSLWNRHKSPYRVRPAHPTTSSAFQPSSDKAHSSSLNQSDFSLGENSDVPNNTPSRTPEPGPMRELTDREERSVHYTFEE